MPQTIYYLLPRSSVGNENHCKAEAATIYEAVMRLDAAPRRVGCTVDMMTSQEAADNELIPSEWFTAHTKGAFPYLSVQIRFDHTDLAEETIQNVIATFNCQILAKDVSPAPFFR